LSITIPSVLNDSEYKSISYSEGKSIVEQFYKAEKLYLLKSGRIEFEIYSETEKEIFKLGETNKPFTPIGWSGLNEPFRYATTVKSAQNYTEVLEWDIFDIISVCKKNPEKATEFFSFILKGSIAIFNNTLNFYASHANKYLIRRNSETGQHENYLTTPSHPQNNFDYLRRAPFLAFFKDKTIRSLSKNAKRLELGPGSRISDANLMKDSLIILEQGWIDLIYSSNENSPKHIFRSISTSGFVISWKGLLKLKNNYLALAKEKTHVLVIDRHSINYYLTGKQKLTFTFYQKLLWLLSNNLQNIRFRYIGLFKDHEFAAVKNLIKQNSAKLKLDSKLHGVPHLLTNIQTSKIGMDVLHELHNSEDHQERVLSSLCLDNLKEFRNEHLLYEGLLETYKNVAYSNHSKAINRRNCSENFIKAFNNTDFLIEGWENLPNESGHIFIYNHLKNHPFNALPNNFQVTLDSHFISSFILYKKYGDPGLRVVRIGKGAEFGHQDYYDKLGHINVYTPESADSVLDDKLKKSKSDEFFKIAQKKIENKINLLISPEGTSFSTDESPGPFKTGVFRLATQINPRPLLIPISVANFDKRARNNTFKCLINTPIDLNDYLSLNPDHAEFKNVAETIQSNFIEYVEKAKNLN